jgi:ATP-binding cassette, subfamily C, bacterial LapB
MISAETLDNLVYEITSRFDNSITPAEARALVASPEETRTLNWLFDVLSDVAIDHEAIESFDDIDLERFHGVGLFWSDSEGFLFSFDELKQEVLFKRLSSGTVHNYDLIKNELFEIEERQILRFFERESENYAIIPGIESHWFFSPLWKNRRFIIQAGLASLLTNVFAVGTSLFAMIVYNRIIPANAMSSLTVLVTGMFILLVADYIVKTSRSKLLGVAGVEADVVIADRLFGQVLDMQYKAKKGSVGTLASTLKEYEQIREFFTSATLVSIIDMPFAIIFVALIWYIGGHMVLPVLFGIGILFFVTASMQPRMQKISERSLQDAHNKHSVLVETLSGLETVKLLGAGGLLRRRFKNVIAKQAELAEETKRLTFFSSNLTQEVQQGVQIAVVTVGAVTVTTGAYGFGAIIACTILSGKALLPFAQLAQLLSRLNQIVTGYKSLNELMQQPVEHARGAQYITRGEIRGGVEFKEVSFSYPGQEQRALDSVSFEIKPGQKIAVVGRVGSGKTTIGKLISKLFLPETGAVYIDGVDIQQIDPAEIRENIGMVSQEPWLIAGTIEQNILLGSPEATTQDLIWAGNLAGVSEFIDIHPKGYKHTVAERGEGLSGGQKQAITIARALVKRPPILLFDEPTSAMDARTEKKFIERLKNERLDCTLIVITHRTSLLALADHVLVVDQGKIVGSGSVENFLNARMRRPDANAAASADPKDTEPLADKEKRIRAETKALKSSVPT